MRKMIDHRTAAAVMAAVLLALPQTAALNPAGTAYAAKVVRMNEDTAFTEEHMYLMQPVSEQDGAAEDGTEAVAERVKEDAVLTGETGGTAEVIAELAAAAADVSGAALAAGTEDGAEAAAADNAAATDAGTAEAAAAADVRTAEGAAAMTAGTEESAAGTEGEVLTEASAEASAEPVDPMERRQQVVDYALSFVGGRYVWGGNDPHTGADCSGFVRYVLQNAAGVSLYRRSAEQATQGRTVSAAEMQPGDLLFYGSGRSVNHVAMYIGNGQIVHASTEKTGIKVSQWNYRQPVRIASFL